LHDNFLAGLEHFGNQLRAARMPGTAGMSAMPAILLVASAATAWPAFETPAPTVTTSAAISTPVASTIRATVASGRTGATPATIAISAATAERTLKARTRIAADTRGLARKFAERLRGLSGNAGARFAGQQIYAVVNYRRCISMRVLTGLVMLVLVRLVMFVFARLVMFVMRFV
jgi:hypothetical protein